MVFLLEAEGALVGGFGQALQGLLLDREPLAKPLADHIRGGGEAAGQAIDLLGQAAGLDRGGIV